MEEQFDRLGFGTRGLIIFMLVLHVLKFTVFDQSWFQYLVLNPNRVIHGEVWRIFTSNLFHVDIIHIFMNMMSFMQLGESFENIVGTLSFLYHILVFGTLTSCLYIFIAWFMAISGDTSAFNGSSVGFSGVLFSLMVIDISLSDVKQRSVFGLFLVPSQFYPWAMLIVTQLIMPSASLIGHASGMLIGYAYQLHLFKYIIPSGQTFSKIERKICCCCLRSHRYLTADGQRPSAFRPYAIFHPSFGPEGQAAEEPEHQQAPPPSAFQGQARTIDTNIAPDLHQIPSDDVERDQWPPSEH